MTAGLILVLAAVLVAEFALRFVRRPMAPEVTSRTTADLQPLLQPSATTFHDLIPRATGRDAAALMVAEDFRVNRLGCRGPDFDDAASDTPYRILFLGDDSVCAPWLSESATLPVQVRSLMQDRTRARLEVINGAVPGDCPLLSRIRFRTILATLRPDLVILHVDMSDVADDMHYRRFLTGRAADPQCPHPALTPSQNPVTGWRATAESSALAAWAIRAAIGQARNTVDRTAADFSPGPYAWITDDPPDLRIPILHALQPLPELQADVEAVGGRLLITTAPVLWQIDDGQHARELGRRCHISGIPPYRTRLPFEVLRQFCEHHGIRFISVTDRFEKDPDPETLFSDSHPVLSSKGLQLYAAGIAEYLTQYPPSRWQLTTGQVHERR